MIGHRDELSEVAEALQRIMPGVTPSEDDPEIDSGSALIKYVTVVDWLTPNGERRLSRISSNLDGEACTAWDMAGLLHDALNGDWG